MILIFSKGIIFMILAGLCEWSRRITLWLDMDGKVKMSQTGGKKAGQNLFSLCFFFFQTSDSNQTSNITNNIKNIKNTKNNRSGIHDVCEGMIPSCHPVPCGGIIPKVSWSHGSFVEWRVCQVRGAQKHGLASA